jgi:hypothetical protein
MGAKLRRGATGLKIWQEVGENNVAQVGDEI